MLKVSSAGTKLNLPIIVTQWSCHTFYYSWVSLAGKGSLVWKKTGAVYDGDWEDNVRHGFGTYNIQRNGELVKQYAGGWKNDKRHVRELC